MSSKLASSGRFPVGQPLIVEVEGYDGEDGTIMVLNGRAESIGLGVEHKLDCIASLDPDGVVRFNDWGYATAEEAQLALKGRLRAQANA